MGGLLVRNFVEALAVVLDSLLTLYWWVVIIAVVISWVSPDPRNPIVRFLHAATQPLFWQVRRWLPFLVIGMVDLSPIVVLLGIKFLQILIVNTLYQLAHELVAVASLVVHV